MATLPQVLPDESAPAVLPLPPLVVPARSLRRGDEPVVVLLLGLFLILLGFFIALSVAGRQPARLPSAGAMPGVLERFAAALHLPEGVVLEARGRDGLVFAVPMAAAFVGGDDVTETLRDTIAAAAAAGRAADVRIEVLVPAGDAAVARATRIAAQFALAGRADAAVGIGPVDTRARFTVLDTAP
jgi:hypothetical protein